jgi:zinc protease
MATVRDKEGLTYGIRSAVDAIDDHLDGMWNISATFAPALLEKGVTSTVAQVEKWVKQGITEEELANKKTTITGTYKVNLATSRSLAGSILTNAERGRPTSYLDEYPKLISALTLDQVYNISNFVVLTLSVGKRCYRQICKA